MPGDLSMDTTGRDMALGQEPYDRSPEGTLERDRVRQKLLNLAAIETRNLTPEQLIRLEDKLCELDGFVIGLINPDAD